MFNPKENLLEQELAVSGLEMQIIPVLVGISAAASVAGGISASIQASENNAIAQRNYEEQKAAAEEAAAKTNEYNQKIFRADKANYYQNRAYDWETTVKNYQYKQAVQEFEYQALIDQYLASIENTQMNLATNSMAELQARESEQASFAEILNEDAFQRESLLIEQLQNEGQVALMQAGKSRSKALQSSAAQAGRALAVMNASVKSAAIQSDRNMMDISLQKFIDDQNVRAAMMLEPIRPPSLPEPVKAPERIFVKPIEATPAFIPAPLQQNTFAPLVQGIGGAASTIVTNKDVFKP